MALKATIHKAELQVNDMDRQYYATHALTLAQHPSETEQRIRKACGRARQVVVISYSGRSADVWWDKIAADLARSKNLTVIDIPAATVQALASLADRNMELQCLIQDGQAQLMSAKTNVAVEPMLRMVPTAQVY